MTSTHLLLSDEDPISLIGILDGSSELQLVHDQGSLADNSQTLHAEHEDLHNSSATVRIKLVDFVSGGNDWQLTATHEDENGDPVTWTRETDHVHQDFGAMTDELEVTVTATEDGSSGPPKTRKIWIKTMPKGAQPDRP